MGDECTCILYVSSCYMGEESVECTVHTVPLAVPSIVPILRVVSLTTEVTLKTLTQTNTSPSSSFTTVKSGSNPT